MVQVQVRCRGVEVQGCRCSIAEVLVQKCCLVQKKCR
jgi:hypothetical protein